MRGNNQTIHVSMSHRATIVSNNSPTYKYIVYAFTIIEAAVEPEFTTLEEKVPMATASQSITRTLSTRPRFFPHHVTDNRIKNRHIRDLIKRVKRIRAKVFHLKDTLF